MNRSEAGKLGAAKSSQLAAEQKQKRINGWTGRDKIYGVVTKVEP